MDYFSEIKKQVHKLENNYKYFKPTIKEYNKEINKIIKNNSITRKKAAKIIMDNLTNIFKNSEDGVEEIIKEKKKNYEIKDEDQARKAVAGKNYERLIAYSLLVNILLKNVDNKIYIKWNTSNDKLLKKYAAINIKGNSQKPDSDLLIYAKSKPIINISCKTSLRERAGQTYKWKLLYDIATSKCNNPKCITNKYDITYKKDRNIKLFFVTADLYDESQAPQQKGMFNFFDKAFTTNKKLSKKTKSLNPFSQIINSLNYIYQ